jgi:endonuclease G, mitochondrial
MRALYLLAFVVSGHVASADVSSLYAGVPKSSEEIRILENPGFVVGYSDARENPLWVAFRLFPVTSTQTERRPSRFRTDSRTAARVRHADYTNSGYDRGHMAPNYAIATRYGRAAQLETFLMSNICPQRPTLNRQVWRRLEERVANGYANDLGEIWVVTGPIFDADRELLPTGVEIPDMFYQIILDELEGKPRALAFIVGQDVGSRFPLESFLVSVDAVERATGIDFFHELEDATERALEEPVPQALWNVSLTRPSRGSPTIQEPATATTNTVYVTSSGSKYHRVGCSYLRNHSRPMSLEAAKRSYGPCSRCKPPR